MMNTNEAIEKALNANVDLSREEFAKKAEEADRITAAHGVGGEAPLTEEERERRMRMNYYGSVLNIAMAVLAAVDDLADKLVTLNNNVVGLANIVNKGGITENVGECNPDSGN